MRAGEKGADDGTRVNTASRSEGYRCALAMEALVWKPVISNQSCVPFSVLCCCVSYCTIIPHFTPYSVSVVTTDGADDEAVGRWPAISTLLAGIFLFYYWRSARRSVSGERRVLLICRLGGPRALCLCNLAHVTQANRLLQRIRHVTLRSRCPFAHMQADP